MKIYLDLQKYSNINNHTKQKKGAYASRARTPALQIYDIQKKTIFYRIRTSCRDTDQPREEQLAWQLSLDDPRDKLRRTT